MIRILKITALTLLLAGGLFAYVLWTQWSEQMSHYPVVVDTRTDEQKARMREASRYNAKSAGKRQAERERKKEEAKTDRIEYSIAEMLAEDKVKPLPFSTFKLLIDRSARERTTVRGSDIREAASPLHRRRDPLHRMHEESSKHAQPTQSRNAITTLTGEPANYPANGQQLVDMLGEYRKLGITHFRSQSFDGISRDEIESIADFMETVVDLRFEVEVLRKWIAVRQEADQLSESYPALKTDPLFNYFVGLTEYECGDYQAARKTLDTATSQFPNSHYPSRDVVSAHEVLLRTLKTIGFEDSTTQTRILCDYCLAVNHWLCHDFRARSDQHLAAMYDLRSFFSLCSQYYIVTGALLTSLGKQEFIPRSIQSATHGLHYVFLNRFYHGLPGLSKKQHGYVKSNQRKGEIYFNDAIALDPDNELVAREMMEFVRNGENSEQEDKFFLKAIACRKDYCDAYWRRLFGLTPQCGGSLKKMIEFARTYGQDGEKDTISSQFVLPMCYFTIRNQVSEEVKEREEALQDVEFVGDVIEALDSIMEQSERLTLDDKIYSRDYLLTTKALLAASIGDMYTSHRMWRQLDGSYDRIAANRFGVTSTFDVMRCESYALSTEFENEAGELKKLMGESPSDRLNNAEKIATLTQSVLDEISNETGRLYFEKAQRQVALEKAYDDGKEISLTFDQELLLWRSDDIAQVRQLSSDACQLDNQIGVFGCGMKSIVHTPGSKIVEFDVELPTAQPQQSFDVLAPSLLTLNRDDTWLAIGVAKDAINPNDRPTLSDRPMAKSAFIVGYWDQQKVTQTVPLSVSTNKIKYRFILGPNYMEVYTNGTFRFRIRLRGEDVGEPDPFFELRQPNSLAGRGVATVSNIRIKKLTNGLPPVDGFDNAALIKYYALQVKQEPDAAWPHFWLAMAHHQSRSFEIAIKHYRKAIDLGVPESHAAFYIGDAYEQLGKQEKAIEYYRKSAEDNDPMYVMFRGDTGLHTIYPQSWAAFRLGWNTVFSPNSDVRESWDPAKFAIPRAPSPSYTAHVLYRAQLYALKGRFKRAQGVVTSVIENCDSDMLPWVDKIAEAYLNENVYTEDPGEPKFYNLFSTPIEFFNFWELY